MENSYTKITKDRGIIETLVVGTMLKNMQYFSEYKLAESDFIIDKTKFFFSLGKTMAKEYKSLDEASVLLFVNTNKKYRDKYNSYGGWDTIVKAMEFSNVENVKAYIDNLQKNNYLLNILEDGTDCCKEIKYKEKNIVPFDSIIPTMTCREVEEFYQGLLARSSSNSVSKGNRKESLIIRKDDREKLKQKEDAGTPYDIIFEYTEKEIGLSDDETKKYVYGLPIMNNKTNGIGNGNGLKVLAGHSGLGKSTIAFFNYLLPMCYRGEKIAIFSNEVNVQYFQQMLTSFVAANVFGYYDLSRTKIKNGEFTEEEEILMEKIEAFLDKRNYEEYVSFFFMEEFDVDEIVTMSKELVSLEGITAVLIDTFKSEDSASDSYVGKITENSKKLDTFGNAYKIKVFLTMQLKNSTENKISYLSGNALAECTAVKNVCELLFLMRRVASDKELNPLNKNFYLKPYRLKQNRMNKKKWDREYIEDLDPNRQYRLLFLDKSRRGEDGTILLLEFHGKTGHFREVGYVENVSRQQLSY